MREWMNNSEYLQNQQYHDASNVSARAALHVRFGTSRIPWHKWVFERLALQPDMQILECGAGPAWLWRENLVDIPPGCQIMLTDLSPGMVAEAEAHLGATGHSFHFQQANIEQLPFEANSFDLIIANHMLYHVPDRAAALAEVRRVLRPGGRFYAATNGAAHMRRMLELAVDLAPEWAGQDFVSLFNLENGAAQLRRHFEHVRLEPFEDRLDVTEAGPILDYLLSIPEFKQIEQGDPRWAALSAQIQAIIDRDGVIQIAKATGLFIAQ